MKMERMEDLRIITGEDSPPKSPRMPDQKNAKERQYAWTIAGYLLTSPVWMIAKGAGEVNRGKMGMQVKKQGRFMNRPYGDSPGHRRYCFVVTRLMGWHLSQACVRGWA
jgi:hypothetical protein